MRLIHIATLLCGLSILHGQTFLNFPYTDANQRAVGENIDTLELAGDIASGSDLANVISQFTGQSNSAISNGLDQMHPAIYGAFAEIDAEVGAQMLSLFCRQPFLSLRPCVSSHVWVDSFANWYDQKSDGSQVGFGSKTWGAALGYDFEVLEGWIIGVGAAWKETEFSWLKGRGHAQIHGYYGAFYTDYQDDNFYLGGSFLAGCNDRFASRHLQFFSTDRHAAAKSNALDLIAQFTGAYFFGIPTFLFFPFANVDFFYLQTEKIEESDADSLDLQIQSRADKTLRTEGGLALQVVDLNRGETMSISPILSFSWAMQKPIGRDLYVSNFQGEPITFNTQGWDKTWQLWSGRLGFKFTYYCLALSADYMADVTIESGDFFAQKCNFRLDYSW